MYIVKCNTCFPPVAEESPHMLRAPFINMDDCMGQMCMFNLCLCNRSAHCTHILNNTLNLYVLCGLLSGGTSLSPLSIGIFGFTFTFTLFPSGSTFSFSSVSSLSYAHYAYSYACMVTHTLHGDHMHFHTLSDSAFVCIHAILMILTDGWSQSI